MRKLIAVAPDYMRRRARREIEVELYHSSSSQIKNHSTVGAGRPIFTPTKICRTEHNWAPLGI